MLTLSAQPQSGDSDANDSVQGINLHIADLWYIDNWSAKNIMIRL